MPGEHRFLRPCPMRLVALGASNLTRGLQAVVGAARRAWGPQTEILAALGHGRSYGVPSRFHPPLPGILQCGLWRALEEAGAAAATRAVVTDVGNDILYGFPPAQILDWVEETVVRLQRSAAQVTLAGLPVDGIGALSAPRFLFFRSLLVPSCRLSLAQVASRAERVQEGLLTLAAARGLRFVPLRATWYGVDPIMSGPRRGPRRGGRSSTSPATANRTSRARPPPRSNRPGSTSPPRNACACSGSSGAAPSRRTNARFGCRCTEAFSPRRGRPRAAGPRAADAASAPPWTARQQHPFGRYTHRRKRSCRRQRHQHQ